METANMNTTTLRDYAKVLFRHKIIIMTAFLTVAGTVYVGLQLQTPVYEARVKMLISGEQQGSEIFYKDLPSRNTAVNLTRSEIVKSSQVVQLAVNGLKLYEQPLDYEKAYASPLKKRLIDKKVKTKLEALNVLDPEDRDAVVYRQAIDRLAGNITVSPVRDTNILMISVKDYSPIMAAILANAVSRAYVIFDLQQQLAESQMKYGEKHPIIRQLKDNIERMREYLSGVQLEGIEGMGPASVKIIEQATPPNQPLGQPKKIIFIIAVGMGLFLGIILAFIFEYMDQTVKSPGDLQKVLNLPILGAIPPKRFFERTFLKHSPRFLHHTAYAKAYDNLAAQFHFLTRKHHNGKPTDQKAMSLLKNQWTITDAFVKQQIELHNYNGKSIQTILVTGPNREQGVSSALANLAYCLAQQGVAKVLIIDANFKHSPLAKVFKVGRNPGLADILEEKITARTADVVKEVMPDVFYMPPGQTQSNPVKLLNSEKMKSFLEDTKANYDIILVDCPDLKSGKEALVLASFVDGTILVIAEGKTRMQVLDNAIAPLKEGGVNTLGAILNNRKLVLPRFIYERL